MSFKRTTTSAFFWASSQQLLLLLLNLVISILLLRILEPKEFGLIGMITIFIALGRIFMNGGLTASLIRTKEPTIIDYSTIFFSNIFFSLIFYIILFLSAPFIASFFQEESLVNILRVYCLVVIIFSFSAIQFAILTKELNFKKVLTIKIPSIIIGGSLGILMAANDFGVWSLVGMYLTQAIVDALQFWFRTEWYPSFVFNLNSFKKHFNFGSKLLLSNALNAIFKNSYNVVIGKLFTAQILGYYTRSQTLANLPVYNLQEVLDKVTFPLFSRIQDDDQKMRQVFQKIYVLLAIIVVPVMLLATLIAAPLFSFFLTDKWLAAVPYFQLICLGGIFYPLAKNNLNILKVKGKSGLMLRLAIIDKIIIGVGLLLIIPFGILGMLYFQVLAQFISFAINASFCGREIQYGLVSQLKVFFKVVLASVFASSIIWIYDYYGNEYMSDFLFICSASLLFLIIYLGNILLLFPKHIKDLKKFLKEVKKKA